MNFLITDSAGHDPSGNSKSKTLIPLRSKVLESQRLSFSLIIHFIPICLKTGITISGVCEGYYRLTVYDGDAHARMRPGMIQLLSKLFNSTYLSLVTHLLSIPSQRPLRTSTIDIGKSAGPIPASLNEGYPFIIDSPKVFKT